MRSGYPKSLWLLCIYSWGWDFRIPKIGYIVWNKGRDGDGKRLYFSPNGTPCHKRTTFVYRGRGARK